MATTDIGLRAEQVAADFLGRRGYEIISRNWRRRECEIDVVAKRHGTVYFVEVKFRMTDEHGSGLEYIGGQKLRQMAYAARRWVTENNWRGQFALAAIEVSGANYEITAFVDDIY